MDLVVVGLNHRTSSVELRERLAMEPSAASAFLERVVTEGLLQEGMVVSTCNRVEVYGLASNSDVCLKRLPEALAAAHALPLPDVYPALYLKRDADAVEHLFSVTASIDSLVIGEPQILGQIKQAFSAAQECGAAKNAFSRVVQRALSVAKRVRSETQISHLAVSVSSIAVDLAKKIFQRLDERSAMLVGAGEMAELAARHFDSSGLKDLYVFNRTYERAAALAQDFQGIAVPFERMHGYLAEADIAVFSAGAPHYLLRADDAKHIMRKRGSRPLFIIDIAVPRNVDPACGEIDNLYLYDIDDLEQIADENKGLREGEAEKARAIVAEESGRYMAWAHAQRVFPVIARLTSRAESIRKAEVERTAADLGATPEMVEKLDLMTAALVRKLLHEPITAVKDAQAADDLQLVEAARRLFRLEEEAAAADTVSEKKGIQRQKA